MSCLIVLLKMRNFILASLLTKREIKEQMEEIADNLRLDLDCSYFLLYWPDGDYIDQVYYKDILESIENKNSRFCEFSKVVLEQGYPL